MQTTELHLEPRRRQLELLEKVGGEKKPSGVGKCERQKMRDRIRTTP